MVQGSRPAHTLGPGNIGVLGWQGAERGRWTHLPWHLGTTGSAWGAYLAGSEVFKKAWVTRGTSRPGSWLHHLLIVT